MSGGALSPLPVWRATPLEYRHHLYSRLHFSGQHAINTIPVAAVSHPTFVRQSMLVIALFLLILALAATLVSRRPADDEGDASV